MKEAAILFVLMSGWVLTCGGAALASEEPQRETVEQSPPALRVPQASSEQGATKEQKTTRRPLPPTEVIQNLELLQNLPLLRDLDLFAPPGAAREGNPKCTGAPSSEGCAGGAR